MEQSELKAGDKVRVCPYRGDPTRSVEGTVLLASANSIAVALGDRPDFLAGVGSFVHPEHGIVLLLSRTEDHWISFLHSAEAAGLYELGEP